MRSPTGGWVRKRRARPSERNGLAIIRWPTEIRRPSGAHVRGHAQGGDIHFALLMQLSVGEVGGVVWAGVELHAALFHPASDGGRFVITYLRRFIVQSRLAQSLLYGLFSIAYSLLHS